MARSVCGHTVSVEDLKPERECSFEGFSQPKVARSPVTGGARVRDQRVTAKWPGTGPLAVTLAVSVSRDGQVHPSVDKHDRLLVTFWPGPGHANGHYQNPSNLSYAICARDRCLTVKRSAAGHGTGRSRPAVARQ